MSKCGRDPAGQSQFVVPVSPLQTFNRLYCYIHSTISTVVSAMAVPELLTILCLPVFRLFTDLITNSNRVTGAMQSIAYCCVSLLLYEAYANESSQICHFLALRPEFHSNLRVILSTPRYCQSATFGRLTFCVYTLCFFYGIRV